MRDACYVVRGPCCVMWPDGAFPPTTPTLHHSITPVPSVVTFPLGFLIKE
jgi:hypothetical protein